MFSVQQLTLVVAAFASLGGTNVKHDRNHLQFKEKGKLGF